MPSASVHFTDIDETVASNNTWLRDMIIGRQTKIIERQKFQFLMVYFNYTIQWLHQNNVVQAETEREHEFVSMAAGLIGFYVDRCASVEVGKRVELTLDGHELELEVTPFKDASFVTSQALDLALVAKDDTAIHQVASAFVELIHFPDRVGFQYLRHVLQMLADFATRGECSMGTLQTLEAIAGTAEEIIPEFKPDYSFHVYLNQPVVEAVQALHDKNEDRFVTAVREVIWRHEQYWSSSQQIEPGDPPLSREEQGWLCLRAVALCKLGQREGIAFNPDSAYAPERLLQLAV